MCKCKMDILLVELLLICFANMEWIAIVNRKFHRIWRSRTEINVRLNNLDNWSKHKQNAFILFLNSHVTLTTVNVLLYVKNGYNTPPFRLCSRIVHIINKLIHTGLKSCYHFRITSFMETSQKENILRIDAYSMKTNGYWYVVFDDRRISSSLWRDVCGMSITYDTLFENIRKILQYNPFMNVNCIIFICEIDHGENDKKKLLQRSPFVNTCHILKKNKIKIHRISCGLYKLAHVKIVQRKIINDKVSYLTICDVNTTCANNNCNIMGRNMLTKLIY